MVDTDSICVYIHTFVPPETTPLSNLNPRPDAAITVTIPNKPNKITGAILCFVAYYPLSYKQEGGIYNLALCICLIVVIILSGLFNFLQARFWLFCMQATRTCMGSGRCAQKISFNQPTNHRHHLR